MNAAELRQRAVELEADLWPDHAEDRRGAAELLAGLANYDPAPRSVGVTDIVATRSIGDHELGHTEGTASAAWSRERWGLAEKLG